MTESHPERSEGSGYIEEVKTRTVSENMGTLLCGCQKMKENC